MVNHGIIPGRLPSDWLSGSIPWVNRNPSGNWYPHLVIGEKQYFSNFDTMACVSFATNNICEIQIKQQTGIEVNESDRFLAKVSGTTHDGNRVSTVLDARRKSGVVSEIRWPKPAEPTSWENYYSALPQFILDEAKMVLVKYDIQYEYITDFSPNNIRKQLQHAPLLVTIPGHEVTGINLSDDGKTLTILDDYIFNVDPAQPFVRTIKLSDVTDIFKAVLTVKEIKMIKMVLDGSTVFLVGDKGKKIGLADPGLFEALKEIASVESGSTAGVPEVKVIESASTKNLFVINDK